MPQVQFIQPPVLSTRQYRPDIDGLRALAVVSVILFHLDISLFSGGFVGVDIFFVISGYLITKLIREELDTKQSFSFSNFYLRRLRRLFPSLAFTFGLCLFAGLLLLSSGAFQRFGSSLTSALLSVSNFFFWKNSGYFAPDAALEPLLHTWSLSVEEQFYLFWPLTLLVLGKIKERWLGPAFLITISLLSLYLNYRYISNTTLIFYLLPFRVFEFAFGAAVVWLDQHKPTNNLSLEMMALAGTVLVAYPIFSYTKYTPFPTANALVPCLGAALLIYAGTARYAGMALSNRWSVKIGLISYSLYLIHWPIIVFYRYYTGSEPLNPIAQLCIFALSVVLATFMYHYIEQPYRRVQKNKSNQPFVLGCLAIGLMILLLAYYIKTHDGLKWRSNQTTEFINAGYGGEHYNWITKLGATDKSTGLIIYGDSHAKQYLAAFDQYAKQRGMAIEYMGHSACFSLPGLTNIYQGTTHNSCIDMLAKLKEKMRENTTPILLAYRYTKTLADLDGKNQLYYEDNEELFIQRLLASLEQLVMETGENRKVILTGNVPSARIKRGYLDCITTPITRLDCHEKFPVENGEFFKLRAALRDFADRHANVLFIDPYQALCDQQYCYVVRDNKLYYSDHAHLSIAGANEVISLYAPEIDHFLSQGK